MPLENFEVQPKTGQNSQEEKIKGKERIKKSYKRVVAHGKGSRTVWDENYGQQKEINVYKEGLNQEKASKVKIEDFKNNVTEDKIKRTVLSDFQGRKGISREILRYPDRIEVYEIDTNSGKEERKLIKVVDKTPKDPEVKPKTPEKVPTQNLIDDSKIKIEDLLNIISARRDLTGPVSPLSSENLSTAFNPNIRANIDPEKYKELITQLSAIISKVDDLQSEFNGLAARDIQAEIKTLEDKIAYNERAIQGQKDWLGRDKNADDVYALNLDNEEHRKTIQSLSQQSIDKTKRLEDIQKEIKVLLSGMSLENLREQKERLIKEYLNRIAEDIVLNSSEYKAIPQVLEKLNISSESGRAAYTTLLQDIIRRSIYEKFDEAAISVRDTSSEEVELPRTVLSLNTLPRNSVNANLLSEMYQNSEVRAILGESGVIETAYENFRNRLIVDTMGALKDTEVVGVNKGVEENGLLLLNHFRDERSLAFAFAHLTDPENRSATFVEAQRKFIKSLTEENKEYLRKFYGKDFDQMLETLSDQYELQSYLTSFERYTKNKNAIKRDSQTMINLFLTKSDFASEPDLKNNPEAIEYYIKNLQNIMKFENVNNIYFEYSQSYQDLVTNLFTDHTSDTNFDIRTFEAIRNKFISSSIQEFYDNPHSLKTIEPLLALFGTLTEKEISKKYPQLLTIRSKFQDTVKTWLRADKDYQSNYYLMNDPRVWKMMRALYPNTPIDNTPSHSLGSDFVGEVAKFQTGGQSASFHMFQLIDAMVNNSEDTGINPKDVELFVNLLPSTSKFISGPTLSDTFKSTSDLLTIIKGLSVLYPEVAKYPDMARTELEIILGRRANLYPIDYINALHDVNEQLKAKKAE